MEKQKLSDALKHGVSTPWKDIALTVLEDDQVVFEGNSDSGARNTAGDLLRIYRLRLKHCRQQGIDVPGLVELVESLAGHGEGTVIQVQPFSGATRGVIAFWNASGDLVGCVTILKLDPERGRQTLDFALGKR